MRVLAAVLLLSILAGCAQPAEQVVVTVAPGETVLRGVVVDQAIVPIANASVSVSEGEGVLKTTTAADGTWEFRGLAGGAHILVVSRVSFLTSQARVSITEGTLSDIVKVVLQTDVSYRKPYVVAYEFTGQIECGAVVSAPPPVGFVAVAACQVPNDATGTDITNDQFMTTQVVDGGTPAWVQSEVVWEPTSQLANRFLFYLDEINATGGTSARPGGGAGTPFTELKRVEGASPLMNFLAAGEMDRLGRGFDLQVRVFAWTDDPAPAGALVEQPFKVYTHVFYGYKPPEGWLFSKDGQPPTPPPA